MSGGGTRVTYIHLHPPTNTSKAGLHHGESLLHEMNDGVNGIHHKFLRDTREHLPCLLTCVPPISFHKHNLSLSLWTGMVCTPRHAPKYFACRRDLYCRRN